MITIPYLGRGQYVSTFSNQVIVKRPEDEGGVYTYDQQFTRPIYDWVQSNNNSGIGTTNYHGINIPWKFPTFRNKNMLLAIPRKLHLQGFRDGYPAEFVGYHPTNYLFSGNYIDMYNCPGLIQSGQPIISYNEDQRLKAAFANSFSEGAELGTAAVTLKKDLTGLAETASDLLKLLRGIKRGNIGDIKSALRTDNVDKSLSKTVSGRYLEYTYAIAPMAGDVYSTYKVLNSNPLTAEILRQRRFRKYDSPGSLDENFKVSGFRSHGYSAHYWWSSPELHRLTQLGFTNPLLIAWDLVPYSFVLDWLIPVGDVLNAFSAYLGAEFVSGFNTEFAEAKFSIAPDMTQFGDFPRVHSWDFYVRTYNRQAIFSFPRPLPYIKNPFSTTHLINAVALFRGAQRW